VQALFYWRSTLLKLHQTLLVAEAGEEKGDYVIFHERNGRFRN
jgi:hypothetical protein